MAAVAASPASFQPSKAAITTGLLSSGTSSSSITTAPFCEYTQSLRLVPLSRPAYGPYSVGSRSAAYSRARRHPDRSQTTKAPAMPSHQPALDEDSSPGRDDLPGRDELPAAVLWDMDGTLVDTEPYWINAEHALVE